MQNKASDIGRVLRIAGWMWIGYLLALIFIDTLMYAGSPRQMLSVYYLANGTVALLFLILSHWPWIEKVLGRLYVPLMLLVISGLSIAASRLFMPRLPPGPMSNIEGIALRLLPILFMGLVITAWQYGWRAVIIFAGGTAGLEIGILLAMPPMQSRDYYAAAFIAIVRSVSFLVVGLFHQPVDAPTPAATGCIGAGQCPIDSLCQHARDVDHQPGAQTAWRVNCTTRWRIPSAVWLCSWKRSKPIGRSIHHRRINCSTNPWVQPARVCKETRRALKALRASPLDDLGLRLALRRLAETAAERANLRLELALPENLPNLSPDVEQCLFRVAQEAIENVVQHAGAKRLVVRLEWDADDVLLVVQDDGMGFNLGAEWSSRTFWVAGNAVNGAAVGGRRTGNR